MDKKDLNLENIPWEDKDLDLAKAFEIVNNIHGNAPFTLVKLQLPKDKSIDNIKADDKFCIEIDDAIYQIINYLIIKYGKDKGMTIFEMLKAELFYQGRILNS